MMEKIDSKMIMRLLYSTALIIFLFMQFIPIGAGQYSPYEEEERENTLPDWMGGTIFCFVCCIFPILWIMIMWWVYKDAQLQGRNGGTWVILLLIFGPIAFIAYLIVRDKGSHRFKSHYRRDTYSRRDQFWNGSKAKGSHLSTLALPSSRFHKQEKIDYTIYTKKELIEECKDRGITVSWWTSDRKHLTKLLEEDDEKVRSDEGPPQREEGPDSAIEAVKKPVLGEKTCPKCHGTIHLYSLERPFKVTCPDCYTSFMLKDRTVKQVPAGPKAPGVSGEGSAGAGASEVPGKGPPGLGTSEVPGKVLAGSSTLGVSWKVPSEITTVFGTKTCPKCQSRIPITSEERPLKVMCPGCGASYTLKKKVEG